MYSIHLKFLVSVDMQQMQQMRMQQQQQQQTQGGMPARFGSPMATQGGQQQQQVQQQQQLGSQDQTQVQYLHLFALLN